MNPDPRIQQITGTAIPLMGHDIDTDQVVPARFLKEISFENMGNYAFYDERFHADGTPKDHPFNAPSYAGASLLIVGRNFGCGSSREHAPQALMRFGIKAIIGISYSEIFAGNCKAIGIPAVTAAPEDIYALQHRVQAQPNTHMTLDLETLQVTLPDGVIPVVLDEARRQSFLTGSWDARAMLLAQKDAILQKSKALPY